MSATPAPNSRASLLAGLRTGGVRSVSGPVPHTAAPAGTFNIPRYTPPVHNEAVFPEEDDELADMVSQSLHIHNNMNRMQQQAPMTAAVDGGANRFAQQQHHGMGNPYVNAQTQMQAMQLQMMQMEIARLQAQQYQAELLAQAQAQVQRQRQVQPRRATPGFIPPATAGPMNMSFEFGSGAQSRANQADQLRAMLGVTGDEHIPMTAAIGGRFGSRMVSGQHEADEGEFAAYLRTPATPNFTNTISGGTALGQANGVSSPNPSKSDSAVSWRRGGNNNSVLSGNRSVSSPLVKVTPPPVERNSPSPPNNAVSPLKTRPPALQFSLATSQPMANTVAVASDGADGDDSSSVSSKSGSTPSTPRTSSSLGEAPPLSPREEASKKLYEGLGISKIPTIAIQAAPPSVQRLVSQPLRQPRGPPSNNDELKPKNFATRGRRKAIGALGALLDAREKREVEAL